MRSIAPSFPPGWKMRKSCGWNPRRSSSATANASPSAICSVVEVVGAPTAEVASGASGRRRITSAARPSALLGAEVMAISGIAKRLA